MSTKDINGTNHNDKTHKSTQKGVIGHNMATTKPTSPQIDHPKKRKIYPN